MNEHFAPNPRLNANTWSRVFHSWISSLLDQSRRKKILEVSDLYELLPEYRSVSLTDQLEHNWLDELKRDPDQPSLLRATIRTMGWTPWLIGATFLPKKAMIIVQPLLIISLMKFFEPCSTMTIGYTSALAVSIIIATGCSIFFHHIYYYIIVLFGMQMRIAYQGLIFRKILRLSSTSLTQFTSGKITNLFSNDASQIDVALQTINYIWVAPVDIVVMIIFFWYFVKYVAFIPIGYTMAVVIFVSLVARLLVHLRRKVLEMTDERVKIMSEIIKSMRIVKMYCWEAAFNKKIRHIRKREIIQMAIRLLPDCIQLLFTHTYVCVTFLIIYGTMWVMNMNFDISFFAVVTSLLGYLELSVMDFGMCIRNLVNYLIAAKRIQAFLLLDESKRDQRLLSISDENKLNNNHPNTAPIVTSMSELSSIHCQLNQAQWQQHASFSLQNIHFTARPGDLICVIGPVGSGKSSLLQTLTGEIACFDGKVRLHGSFCYVPQEPWIFSSTIRANILFGKDYEPHLFRQVIRATALDTDLAQLPRGMNTTVGDQGVMLSGGQKARVNMARALYRNADIYLLDDPLSAVDVQVSKHLFEKSIKSYLHEKICILVTHQIQFLRDATEIIILENGAMVEKGSYDDLVNRSTIFARLLENIHQQQADQKTTENITPVLRRLSTRCSTVSKQEDVDTATIDDTNAEKRQSGTVHFSVYFNFLRAGLGLMPSVFLLLFICSMREATFIIYNHWLAKWSDDETNRFRLLNNCTHDLKENVQQVRSMNQTEWKNYRTYRFHVFSGIAIVVIIISFLRILLIRFLCLNSGRVLHNTMFQRILRCPIAFFDLNPAGRILNRFTKDIAVVDDNIPVSLFDYLQSIFQILGVLVFVSWINPWSLIPTAIAFMILLYIRHRFACCSRDLKRLESVLRSPVYSYLTSTLSGLQVIRSYHAEKTSLAEFFSHVDNNTRAFYLLATTNRWAAIRFDWTTLFFFAIVLFLALLARVIGEGLSVSDIALTLTFTLNLVGLLQWTMRQSVDIETQMTSVERILEYCSLEQEPPAQVPPQHRPPPHWPSQGQITFNDVSMSHSKDPHAPLALSHLSLNIHSAEKIGIVGRTGAGKSSFIQTLFRMGTLVHGQIIIDHIDIASVGLDDVRRRISIIPQDPVLFTGTMRTNLDQFGDYSDAEIWHALEQVQLKRLVTDVMSEGLQSIVSESGSNLSVGQKQLVCLARAILKKSKILVIDEATANVDNATDELIQRSIREQFKDCTVLTVAHRLRTVIDSDRIMVLGDGRLLEFGSPAALLDNDESEFSLLVNQSGTAEAEYLRTMAKNMLNKHEFTASLRSDNRVEEHRMDATENDPLIV